MLLTLLTPSLGKQCGYFHLTTTAHVQSLLANNCTTIDFVDIEFGYGLANLQFAGACALFAIPSARVHVYDYLVVFQPQLPPNCSIDTTILSLDWSFPLDSLSGLRVGNRLTSLFLAGPLHSLRGLTLTKPLSLLSISGPTNSVPMPLPSLVSDGIALNGTAAVLILNGLAQLQTIADLPILPNTRFTQLEISNLPKFKGFGPLTLHISPGASSIKLAFLASCPSLTACGLRFHSTSLLLDYLVVHPDISTLDDLPFVIMQAGSTLELIGTSLTAVDDTSIRFVTGSLTLKSNHALRSVRLRQMITADSLWIEGNTNLCDLDVRSLVQASYVRIFANSKFCSLLGLRGLRTVDDLDVEFNNLRTLDGLQRLTTVNQIRIDERSVADFSALQGVRQAGPKPNVYVSAAACCPSWLFYQSSVLASIPCRDCFNLTTFAPQTAPTAGGIVAEVRFVGVSQYAELLAVSSEPDVDVLTCQQVPGNVFQCQMPTVKEPGELQLEFNSAAIRAVTYSANFTYFAWADWLRAKSLGFQPPRLPSDGSLQTISVPDVPGLPNPNSADEARTITIVLCTIAAVVAATILAVSVPIWCCCSNRRVACKRCDFLGTVGWHYDENGYQFQFTYKSDVGSVISLLLLIAITLGCCLIIAQTVVDNETSIMTLQPGISVYSGVASTFSASFSVFPLSTGCTQSPTSSVCGNSKEFQAAYAAADSPGVFRSLCAVRSCENSFERKLKPSQNIVLQGISRGSRLISHNCNHCNVHAHSMPHHDHTDHRSIKRSFQLLVDAEKWLDERSSRCRESQIVELLHLSTALHIDSMERMNAQNTSSRTRARTKNKKRHNTAKSEAKSLKKNKQQSKLAKEGT